MTGTPPVAERRPEPLLEQGFWHRPFVWLIPTVMAGALTALTLVLPADRGIDNIAEWLLRISPLVFAVFAAALFPRKSGRNLVLLVLVIVGFMGLFDTFIISRILEYAHTPEQQMPDAFPKLYQMTILLDAFVLIVICFGYRLGGAKSYKVVRLGLAGIFVVTSGLNDLTYFYLHDSPEGRPDTLDAPHIAVFVGGNPTPAVAIAFCVVNLGIAAAIIVVPWIVVRRRRTAEATLLDATPEPVDTTGPASSDQLGQ